METLLKQPAKLLQWTKTETKEKAAMKRQNQWYQLNVVQMVVLALALNLLIELLNHKGVGALFSFYWPASFGFCGELLHYFVHPFALPVFPAAGVFPGLGGPGVGCGRHCQRYYHPKPHDAFYHG